MPSSDGSTRPGARSAWLCVRARETQDGAQRAPRAQGPPVPANLLLAEVPSSASATGTREPPAATRAATGAARHLPSKPGVAGARRAAKVARKARETGIRPGQPRRDRRGRDLDRARVPRPPGRPDRPALPGRHRPQGIGRPRGGSPPQRRGPRHRPRRDGRTRARQQGRDRTPRLRARAARRVARACAADLPGRASPVPNVHHAREQIGASTPTRSASPLGGSRATRRRPRTSTRRATVNARRHAEPMPKAPAPAPRDAVAPDPRTDGKAPLARRMIWRRAGRRGRRGRHRRPPPEREGDAAPRAGRDGVGDQ